MGSRANWSPGCKQQSEVSAVDVAVAVDITQARAAEVRQQETEVRTVHHTISIEVRRAAGWPIALGQDKRKFLNTAFLHLLIVKRHIDRDRVPSDERSVELDRPGSRLVERGQWSNLNPLWVKDVW